MKIPYEFWFAMKFSRIYCNNRKFNRDNHFISFVTLMSSLGIALGVASLIIVLSVMNGFQKEVRERMLSMLPHIELYIKDYTSTNILHNWEEIFNLSSKSVNNINAGSPFVSSQAVLMKEKSLNGVQVKGIDFIHENEVSNISKYMLKGSLENIQENTFNIIIGSDLANNINAQIGDSIYLISPSATFNSFGFIPNIKKFNIIGIFASGYYEYDIGMVFINIKDAIKIFDNSAMCGIRLKISDMNLAPMISQELNDSLPDNILSIDWSLTHKNWFSAIQTEKKMMFLILMIIIIIAIFNLSTSLIMTVKDKEKDIAILKTFGINSINVAFIFILQGIIISIIGIIIGVLFGLIITLNLDSILFFIERIIGFSLMPKDVYLLDKLPYNIQIEDIVVIIFVTFFSSILATIYPSLKASRTEPAKILRNG